MPSSTAGARAQHAARGSPVDHLVRGSRSSMMLTMPPMAESAIGQGRETAQRPRCARPPEDRWPPGGRAKSAEGVDHADAVGQHQHSGPARPGSPAGSPPDRRRSSARPAGRRARRPDRRPGAVSRSSRFTTSTLLVTGIHGDDVGRGGDDDLGDLLVRFCVGRTGQQGGDAGGGEEVGLCHEAAPRTGARHEIAAGLLRNNRSRYEIT